MFELPRIKIEVENMKYQIIHAFASHNDEIGKAVDQELTRVIANYPFSEEVSQLANDVIARAIKATLEEYFLYGEGRKEISEGINKLMSGLTKRALDGAKAPRKSKRSTGSPRK